MINKAACVACTILLAAYASVRAGGVEEETTETTYQVVGANPTLTVHNTDGRIFVYGSEAGEIKVKAYKRAFTKERVQQIKANVSLEGDAMTIDTFYPPTPEGLLADRSGTVEYTILVPENCITKVELSQGEIQVHGLRGPSIDVKLMRGLISLKSCYAPMQISLGAGGVDISYDWWEDLVFPVLANVREGDITLQFPPTAALRIDAATQSGHVRNYLVPDEQRGADVQNMQTALGGGSEVLFTVRTGKGNIRLGKPY